jgi:D-citramalate synthase
MNGRNRKWGIALSPGRKNNLPEKIRFFDTTLRDGEQTPGVSLTPENKLRIARRLDELGVDVIEAGFAAASKGELQAIKLISNEGLKAEICSMARAVKNDIEAVVESDADSVHLVVPTSDLHLRYKLKKTREEVLKLTGDCVQYAKDHGLTVELTAEDSTRSDLEYVKQVFSTGISFGADRICPADTVGVLTPERSYYMFSEMRRAFKVPISAHCHNDFGMAAANSIAALLAGANQVHVTVNGLGERAGNAAFEEIVMALNALYGVKLPIRTELIFDTSQLVARLTGIYVQPNKAIVGRNAFAHESGMHTHGILSNPFTYEPISPETIGAARHLVAGKHAGSHGIRAALEQMRLKPSDEQLKEIFQRVKNLGDKGKEVTDADLQAIAEAVMGLPKIRPIQLKELTVVTGDKVTPTASVKIEVNSKLITEAATGVGPVDAAINAIRKAVSAVTEMQLDEYSVKAITGGTDAVVEVIVRLRKGNRIVTATGARGDIVMASVDAVLSAANLLMISTDAESAFNH